MTPTDQSAPQPIPLSWVGKMLSISCLQGCLVALAGYCPWLLGSFGWVLTGPCIIIVVVLEGVTRLMRPTTIEVLQREGLSGRESLLMTWQWQARCVGIAMGIALFHLLRALHISLPGLESLLGGRSSPLGLPVLFPMLAAYQWFVMRRLQRLAAAAQRAKF